MIQLHRLEGFYWVAQAGGYARAARACPYAITQPALHQQVRKLEKELGLQLLERVGKDRMVPTAAGRRLFEFTAPFFRDLPATLQSLREGRYGGTLTVQAEPLLIRHLMPAWLGRLQRRHPDIRVELSELAEPSVEPLRRGVADAMLAYLADEPPDIATLEVGRLHPFVVLPRGHAAARRRRLHLADLGAETFISYRPGTVPHDLQMRALAAHGVAPRQTIAVDSTDTILGFVASGLGVSLVPSLDRTGPKGRGLAARPFTAPRITFPVVLAWRKDAPDNPLLDAFLACAS